MPSIKKKPARTRSSLRFEPPTLDEAIFAAQGLADDIAGQTEIAAMLMGLPEAEVRKAIMKATTAKPRLASQLPNAFRAVPARQPFVVERRVARVLSR